MMQSQIRVGGMGTPYGLDWTVIARVADDAGIVPDFHWWQLLRVAEIELLKVLNPPKKSGDGG